MTIVCGTDFSTPSIEGARVAAALAERLSQPLWLVHVIERGAAEVLFAGAEGAPLREAVRIRLHEQAEALRAQGITVEEEVLEGDPEERLAAVADRTGARLVVVGSVGWHPGTRFRLGSTAERLAALAPAPVLVVRDGEALAAWARGERDLRVWVGDDLTAASDPALRWVAELARLGTCEVAVAHVFFPPELRQRFGLKGGLLAIEPELESHARGMVERHAGPLLAGLRVRYFTRGSLGRPADTLVRLAEEERADLVVVGTRQRRGVERVWHGSTSQVVLHYARASVACVPSLIAAEVRPIPDIRRVLAPTDLSPASNRAIPYAFALAGAGGVVHLLHVVKPGAAGDAAQEAERQLADLVPEEARLREIEFRIEVVEGADVGRTICQASERLDVDAVCIAPSGKTGLTRALSGSVTRCVFQQSRRPVFLVPPDAEV